MASGSNLSNAFVKQFERKKLRDRLVAEMLSSRLAKMIRSLREQRGWTQKQLAKKLSTTQSAISRIESAEYGKVSVQTLLEVAAAFDLPLFIDMPEWRDWFGKMRDFSAASFARRSFDVGALSHTETSTTTASLSTSSVLTQIGTKVTNGGVTLTVFEGGKNSIRDDFEFQWGRA